MIVSPYSRTSQRRPEGRREAKREQKERRKKRQDHMGLGRRDGTKWSFVETVCGLWVVYLANWVTGVELTLHSRLRNW